MTTERRNHIHPEALASTAVPVITEGVYFLRF